MILDDDNLPQITTAFNVSKDSTHQLYFNTIPKILKKIIPKDFFVGKGRDRECLEELRAELHEQLPLLTRSEFGEVPFNLSVFLLSKCRSNAFKFFFEMISRWLVPGKRLNVVLFYGVDFCMPDLGNDVYTLCEVMMQIESREEFEELQRNFPIIETEVRLGVASAYYARRILEIRGLTADEKTAIIQEHITHLVKRLPHEVSYNIFSEMQHVLVTCRDDFKATREARHMARIISIHYLFRRGLRRVVKEAPDKRHLSLKIVRTRLHLSNGVKTVLAILIGVNFLNDKEAFEERHILKAIQNYIPNVSVVEDSFFSNRRGSEKIGTIYLEIAKADGTDFCAGEIKRLRRELPGDLKDRIEHLMHPVFMPRNEEEIMRNILSLSSQIKYIRDIPQLIISFDEQTGVSLFFTVILVRVAKPGDLSLQEMFANANSYLKYVHDRCKTVGYLRKRYPKEATVFRVKIPKERFLRGDHSIDLYKARQVVVSELMRIVGEVRDFNGGMISKQNELFCALRSLLDDGTRYNDLLLENFFYSLTPIIMRSVLDAAPLKKLFLMLLDAIEEGFFKGGNYSLKIQSDADFVYVMITSDNRAVKEEISRTLSRLEIPTTQLATASVNVYDNPCVGYLYRYDDEEQRENFCHAIREAMHVIDESVLTPAL